VIERPAHLFAVELDVASVIGRRSGASRSRLVVEMGGLDTVDG